MAAGTKCKLRMFDYASSTKTEKLRIDMLALKQKLLGNFNNNLYLFEMTYEAANAARAEISPPTAVFSATTSQHKPLAIVSSDAKDTSAGVGVRTVKCIVINHSGAFEILTFTMAGQTNVVIDDYPCQLLHMYTATVGSEGDAAGNITLSTRGYQEGGLSDLTSSSIATGLSAETEYQYQINDNGGGNHNYTVTTGTDLTWGAILTLLNAQSGAVCTFAIVGGDIRCTSLIGGASSSIEMSAGAGGTDLFGAITGWYEEAKVDGAVYLQISATYNESDGSAIFLPTSYAAMIARIQGSQITNANSGKTIIEAVMTNCGNGADPDLDTIKGETQIDVFLDIDDDTIWISDGSGKITWYQTQITGEETFHVKAQVLVFGTTDAQRGVLSTAVQY